jgi:DNA-binding response OmpR family regulator
MDRRKLEAILSNLLANAAKFTPAGGAVRFAAAFEPLSANQGLLRVVVEDTGIGIAAGELERIFERFYQADASATRSYEGSGIGLSLVKELVALYGGEVKAASTPGKGTTFTVEIPLPLAEPGRKSRPSGNRFPGECHGNARSHAPCCRRQGAQPGCPPVRTGAGGGGPRRTEAVHYGGAGGAVRRAGSPNGLEGYRMALEGLPDLIISDVMMPGMDGFTLCSTLKTDPRTSHIPVVLLTAKADAESKLAGLETGADDYLTKPFGLEELLLRVRNLLESRRKLREKYGKQLTLNPKEITVTSTDAQFLERALSIMETQMANPDFDVEAFSREVAMSRSQLHRKLVALTGQGPGDFIRTIRLKRAAALLQSQAGNVSDVAYRVGFTNLPYFSKAFREHFGQTPSSTSAAEKPRHRPKLPSRRPAAVTEMPGKITAGRISGRGKNVILLLNNPLPYFMMYRYLPASPHLRPYIQHYVLTHLVMDKHRPVPPKPYPAKPQQGITFYIRSGMVARVPHTGLVQAYADTIVLGQHTHRQTFQFASDYLMFHAEFEPGALGRFLGVPMPELLNTNLDARLLLGPAVREVNEQLAEVYAYADMQRIVEDFLWQRIRRMKDPLLLVDTLGRLVLQNPHGFDLKSLAGQACLSPSQFQRRFARQVGVPPKVYARLARFYKAFQVKKRAPHLDWLTVACQTG